MSQGAWVARDLEYGYDTLIENVVDPAHVPFAHHNVQAKRSHAVPLNVSVRATSAQGDGWVWGLPLLFRVLPASLLLSLLHLSPPPPPLARLLTLLPSPLCPALSSQVQSSSPDGVYLALPRFANSTIGTTDAYTLT